MPIVTPLAARPDRFAIFLLVCRRRRHFEGNQFSRDAARAGEADELSLVFDAKSRLERRQRVGAENAVRLEMERALNTADTGIGGDQFRHGPCPSGRMTRQA